MANQATVLIMLLIMPYVDLPVTRATQPLNLTQESWTERARAFERWILEPEAYFGELGLLAER